MTETITLDRVRSFRRLPQFAADSTEARSVAAALTASDMLWTPEFKPLFTENAESLGGLEPVTSHRALVRSDNGRVLGIHGGGYHAVGQLEAFEPTLQPLLDAGELRITRCRQSHGGAKVWIEAQFASGGEQDVKVGDTVASKIVFSNSHDGTTLAMLQYLIERLACLNGMTSTERSAVFRARHTKSIRTEIEAWRVEFAAQRAALGSAVETWRAMARRRLNDAALKAYVREVLSPGAAADETIVVRGVDRIIELAETAPGADPGTLWGGLNAVTYWTTHERGRSDDARVNANLFGTGGEMVQRAQDVAVQLIERLPTAELARESYANHATAAAEFGALLGKRTYKPSESATLFDAE